jgi:hypothetical protein
VRSEGSHRRGVARGVLLGDVLLGDVLLGDVLLGDVLLGLLPSGLLPSGWAAPPSWKSRSSGAIDDASLSDQPRTRTRTHQRCPVTE